MFLFIDTGGRGREIKGKRERHGFIVPLIDAFIGCFLYVPDRRSNPRPQPYREDSLIDWPGPGSFCIFEISALLLDIHWLNICFLSVPEFSQLWNGNSMIYEWDYCEEWMNLYFWNMAFHLITKVIFSFTTEFVCLDL